MPRYSSTPQKLNQRGQRVLVSTIYPPIPLSDSDRFIYPKDGDRLDNIAFRYYNNASLWWVIAQANGLGKGRTILNPNFQIRIPGDVEKILSEYTKLNS
jgi:phage tail protein X